MSQIDPITLEVVRGHLVSTVHQMRATLLRTAYSPILYEGMDFSCGLMNGSGEVIGMSDDFSGHVFAMNLGLRATLEKFEGRIYPADVFAVNDPYTGGTHLNDIAFYTPFFVGDRTPVFIGVRAHFADVGGATPGSFSGQDTEIYQEGVRLVPVKIIERGRVNQALWDVMFANMRQQEEREGDALAMLDTSRVAEMLVTQLFEKYGAPVVEECVARLLDNAESTIREEARRLPQGEYYYEHYLDNDGLSATPVPIKVRLAIDGDTMTFDFTGTSEQVAGPMNCGVPITMGGVFVIVKSWLDPNTPVNGGTFRPLSFVIPEGTILSAQLPAAVGGCWEVYRQVQAATMGLFSQVMPDALGGENLGTTNHVYITGYDPGRARHYILYEYPHGGNPATSDTDGSTATKLYDVGDSPGVWAAEVAEQREPMLIESLEVLDNGEGPGLRRSGFGVNRRIRMMSGTSQLSVMADRAVIPPWGAAGADPGMRNAFIVIRAGREIQPSPIPGKVKAFPLEIGDVVQMQATAGGGVGDPLEREPTLVIRDVHEGYLTAPRARDVYGVVIEADQVDLEETRQRREALRKQRSYFEVIDSEDDEFDHRGCRVCPLGPQAAAKVGVRDGDMVEYVSKTTAPLRAWARVVDDVRGEGVPLGPVGRSILRVEPGDLMWIRSLGIEAPSGPK